MRSAAGVDYPDIQFHFLPLAVRYDGKAAVRGHGFQAHVGADALALARRGAAAHPPIPTAPPAIRFNYMSHERGLERLPPLHPADPRDLRAAGLRALSPARRSSPARASQTDDELDAFVREHAESAYHPCGTARIGRRDDPMAVVDPEAG